LLGATAVGGGVGGFVGGVVVEFEDVELEDELVPEVADEVVVPLEDAGVVALVAVDEKPVVVDDIAFGTAAPIPPPHPQLQNPRVIRRMKKMNDSEFRSLS